MAASTLPEISDFNLKILSPIARYFRDRGEEDKLEAICLAGGIQVEDFDRPVRWISHAQFEKILAATHKEVGEEAFMKACAHRLSESYGPLRFFFWAASPRLVYRTSESASRLFSSVARFEVVHAGESSATLRYVTERRESRLMCLSRQAQSSQVPVLWGMPPATCKETKCVTRGDECCEYTFSWYARARWLPAMLGALAGFVVVSILTRGAPFQLTWSWCLPVLGGLVGQLVEQTRTQAANRKREQESTEALQRLATDDAEARRELLELHARQREWTRILEDEAAERQAALSRLTRQFRQVEEKRELALRGFSHDLRNPLTVLSGAILYLQENRDKLGPEGAEVLGDLEYAHGRMHDMLQELMKVVTSQRAIVELVPERFEIAPVAERLRRRLRALVHGRDIRVTVFSTREAPEFVHIDPLLFDRVIDNLLTNAAKYTERGSIVVEVDGTPGFLVVKVSDTGRGIDAESLEGVFLPGGSDASKRARDSYGIGLSVVLDLLDQIGGRLEVMSKPGEGTTFWVYLPVQAQPRRVSSVPPAASLPEARAQPAALGRVLKIRKSA
jgi:signal transduction histidine kinase